MSKKNNVVSLKSLLDNFEHFYYLLKSIILNLDLNYEPLQDDLINTLIEIYNIEDEDKVRFLEMVYELISKFSEEYSNDESVESFNLGDFIKNSGFDFSNREINHHLGRQLLDKMNQIANLPKMNRDSSIISLTTYFENFISDLVSFHLSENKEKIQSTLELTSTDVSKLTDINYLYEDLIEKDVTKLLEMPFKKMLDELFSSYDNEYFKEHKSYIIELFARRNSIVHSKNCANKKYMDISGNPYKLKLGQTIEIDEFYIIEQTNRIITLGLLLVSSELSKYEVSDLSEEDLIRLHNIIEKAAFDQLVEHNWENAYYIYKKLRKNDLFINSRENYNLNCLLAGKHISDKQILKEIKSYDYRSKKVTYSIAYLGLTLKYDEIITTINTTNETINLDAWSLENWPIFHELRTVNPEKFNKVLDALNKKLNS